MTDADKQELYRIVRNYFNRFHGPYMRVSVEGRITAAHMGRPDGSLVTNDNLDLFRQYRNGVSPSAARLVDEALGVAVSGKRKARRKA